MAEEIWCVDCRRLKAPSPDSRRHCAECWSFRDLLVKRMDAAPPEERGLVLLAGQKALRKRKRDLRRMN